MFTNPAVRVPFDLSALPDGFRRTVEREFSPKAHKDAHEALLWAVSSAWGQSTAKQRQSAEDGVNGTLRALLADRDAPWGSYAVGVIGGTCLDLAMRFFDVDQLETDAVLRGVQDAGGIRVNSAISDCIDGAIRQVAPDAVIADSKDMLAVDVCARTIPLPDERRDLAEGIRRAFKARPQRGRWRVAVVGENNGNSDRYAITFARAGTGGGAVVDQGTLVCSISDLHINGQGPGGPRERLIAEVKANVELWLRERGMPAPERSLVVRPSGNIVEFVDEPDTARARDITHMVDRRLFDHHGVRMAEVKLAFVQGSRHYDVEVIEAWGRRSPDEQPHKITDDVKAILKLEASLPKRLGYVRVCVVHHNEPMADYYYCLDCAVEKPPVVPGAELKPARRYWEITEEEWDACKRESANASKRYQHLCDHYPLQDVD